MMDLQESQSWKETYQNIERSRITRVDWSFIFGESLTKVILRHKFGGASTTEIYQSIKNSSELQTYLLKQNKGWIGRVLNNLWISINARCAESSTELKVLNEKVEE